jgi:hypothetical protein
MSARAVARVENVFAFRIDSVPVTAHRDTAAPPNRLFP